VSLGGTIPTGASPNAATDLVGTMASAALAGAGIDDGSADGLSVIFKKNCKKTDAHLVPNVRHFSHTPPRNTLFIVQRVLRSGDDSDLDVSLLLLSLATWAVRAACDGTALPAAIAEPLVWAVAVGTVCAGGTEQVELRVPVPQRRGVTDFFVCIFCNPSTMQTESCEQTRAIEISQQDLDARNVRGEPRPACVLPVVHADGLRPRVPRRYCGHCCARGPRRARV
jgi:hypothetical protein